MPIASSGVIRLSDIQNEFGGTNPINLSEYYQNSTTNFTTGISGIPNIGSTFNMSVFYNKAVNAPYTTNIFARYTADGPFTKSGTIITQWNDLSGNNRHVTSAYFRGNVIQSTFTQGAKGLAGTSTLNTVKGNNTDGLYFPFVLTQGSYTFAYIARYTGDKNNTTYNRRIFESRAGTGENTIWGFHDKTAGRSHNGNRGWVSTTEYKQSEPEWWMIGIDTEITARYNGLNATNNYTFQNNSYPIRPITGFNPTPAINFGTYTGQNNSNETSNWEVMELIFYNRELTLSEQINVENYFSKKYKHISFINISPSFGDFINYCSQQIVLYELFNFVYNGNKWGYTNINVISEWYGPGFKNFMFYKKNNRFYWILNIQNGNSNNLNIKYSNGGNRNMNNTIYTITIPNNNGINFKVHAVINGAGGGGSIYGAGGGGQTYFYNSTKLYNKTLTLNIGNIGNSFAVFNTNCSGGGDTTVSWDTYSLIGYGGREGDSGTGGINSVNIPSGMLGGGANGGNGGITASYYGGAIPTITNTINLYSDTTLWSIINDPSIANVYSYNSTWFWANVYGAGGMGYRGAVSGDPYSRRGMSGGPGFVIIILDYNDNVVLIG